MKTYSIGTVDDDPAVAVTAQTVCRKITVGESEAVADWPTVDWIVMAPLSTDAAIRKTRGTKHVFEMPPGQWFRPGDIPGYIKTPTSTGSTFVQVEE